MIITGWYISTETRFQRKREREEKKGCEISSNQLIPRRDFVSQWENNWVVEVEIREISLSVEFAAVFICFLVFLNQFFSLSTKVLWCLFSTGIFLNLATEADVLSLSVILHNLMQGVFVCLALPRSITRWLFIYNLIFCCRGYTLARSHSNVIFAGERSVSQAIWHVTSSLIRRSSPTRVTNAASRSIESPIYTLTSKYTPMASRMFVLCVDPASIRKSTSRCMLLVIQVR